MLTCISVVILDVQPLFKLALGQTFVQSLNTLYVLKKCCCWGDLTFLMGQYWRLFTLKN